jgi:hypothetical protein
MRIAFTVGTDELHDRTTYNIAINDQPFATVDSTGKNLTVTFNADHPGNDGSQFNTGERIWLVNHAMMEFDVRDSWSDFTFDYEPGSGVGPY